MAKKKAVKKEEVKKVIKKDPDVVDGKEAVVFEEKTEG